MRRYYFDIREDDEIVPDEEGLELPTIGRVQEEAARSLADIAKDSMAQAPNGEVHHLSIEVRDNAGPVMRVQFAFDMTLTRRLKARCE